MKSKVLILLFCAFIATQIIFYQEIKAEDKVVNLASLEWEPYIGEKLENKGFVAEIVTEAFKRTGYKVNVSFFPWARAVMMAESGEQDGLFPEYYDKTREEKFVYSEPFAGGPVGLYARKDKKIAYKTDPMKNQTQALKELSQYKFGVVREYVNTAEFDAASFLNKEEVTSDELNIKKLYNDRIQLIFIDKFIAKDIIKKISPEYEKELEFLEPPLEIKQFYIVFSKRAKNYEEKLKAFNDGLKQIKQDKTLEKIMSKHGFN